MCHEEWFCNAAKTRIRSSRTSFTRSVTYAGCSNATLAMTVCNKDTLNGARIFCT